MMKFPFPHHLVFCRIPANLSRKDLSVGSVEAMLQAPSELREGPRCGYGAAEHSECGKRASWSPVTWASVG